MITREQFDVRVDALWASQQRMAAARKWKSGKRAGMVRTEAKPLLFNKKELHAALWTKVGFNAVLCPYCNAGVDILDLTLDHIIPRSAGGEMSLRNLDICCKDCNEQKGDMTHDAFVQLLAFAQTLSAYDRSKLLGRLKAAHHGSPARFFRKPQQQPQPAASKKSNYFNDDPFF